MALRNQLDESDAHWHSTLGHLVHRQGLAHGGRALMAAHEFVTFLHLARQSRLLAQACPSEADYYKSNCRYWLAMARRAQGPPLPFPTRR